MTAYFDYDLLGEALYFIGAVLIALSLMMSRLTQLRFTYLGSTIIYIVYGAYMGSPVIILTSLVFAIINGYKIAIHLNSIQRGKDLIIAKDAYALYFQHLNIKDFLYLLGISEVKKIKSGVIVEEGEKIDQIILILSGEADVLVEEKTFAKLKCGDFIGEFGALAKCKASATVKCHDDVYVAIWSASIVNTERNLMKMVALNVIKKLIRDKKLLEKTV